MISAGLEACACAHACVYVKRVGNSVKGEQWVRDKEKVVSIQCHHPLKTMRFAVT